MSLGPTELLVVIINLVLILAIPAIIIVSAVLLVRRIRDLEARVAKLEEEETDRGKSPGNGL
jgi:uncharacterized membrane protein YhaH (DUF805 family)